MEVTPGQKVRVVPNYYANFSAGEVVTVIRPTADAPDSYSWVSCKRERETRPRIALIYNADLEAAEPVTTPEEAARYERVERVLDVAALSVNQAGWGAGWFELPPPSDNNYNERPILAALLLDLMERGEL